MEEKTGGGGKDAIQIIGKGGMKGGGMGGGKRGGDATDKETIINKVTKPLASYITLYYIIRQSLTAGTSILASHWVSLLISSILLDTSVLLSLPKNSNSQSVLNISSTLFLHPPPSFIFRPCSFFSFSKRERKKSERKRRRSAC
nr:hypothetical protein [Morchella crassipes]